jgi:hypothetical protein
MIKAPMQITGATQQAINFLRAEDNMAGPRGSKQLPEILGEGIQETAEFDSHI